MSAIASTTTPVPDGFAPSATPKPVHPSVKSIPEGKVMIVDDEISNVLVVKKHLERAGYTSFETTTESTAALSLLKSSGSDLLLLDINMPGISGIDILREMRADPQLHEIPVLILTANTEESIKWNCLELGATDFLIKPVDAMELVPRVRNALIANLNRKFREQYAAELEKKVHQRTVELEASRREAIFCLARAAEMRDNDTGNHVIRVGRYAGIIAKALGCPDWFVVDIEVAAQLHDVGKIAIPDSILLKPGKLEPQEFEIIQNHVKLGHQIIKPFAGTDATKMRDHVSAGSEMLRDGSSLMRLAATIAQTHHEKFDGSGYPLGLAGEDIPLEGRIAAVADVYDALSAERPYKKALPREKCFEIMREGRGKHFDPEILDAFFESAHEIVQVQLEYMDICEKPEAPTV